MLNFSIISCVPSDLYFASETRIQLFQMRNIEYSKYFRILIFVPNDRINLPIIPEWKKLEEDYPEAKFFYYYDTENFLKTIKTYSYIPLLRPYMLHKHWLEYPHLEKEAFLYLDSDCLILKPLPIEHLLDNNICYLSDTKSYNAASYFDSKRRDVILSEVDKYDKIDVLEECTNLIGINREIAEKNENNTGGAQWILKGIDAQFWADVVKGCIDIKLYLNSINRKYFPSENAGFQVWANDMWSVLWNLWKRNIPTETPSFMDFSWATDNIKRWDETYIFHNAGATNDTKYLFNKRDMKYVNNISTPFEEDFFYVSPEYCSYNYCKIIEQANPNK